VLIDPQLEASYSGMVPGCVSGLYTEEETKIKLGPLAAWAGMSFINKPVVDIDVENNILLLSGDETVEFDVCSIDVGSTTRGFEEVPGAKEFGIPTRPISALTQRIEVAAAKLVEQNLQNFAVNVAIVGGGAAGIELAFGMKARWSQLFNDGTHTASVNVTLLNSGDKLMATENEMCRHATNAALESRGIKVRHNCRVMEVTATHVSLACGDAVPAEHVIWATGAACHPLAETLRDRGLAVDDRNWIKVSSSLQSVNCPSVFAAGDCCTIAAEDGRKTPPKAGVYAVRSGPILIENLSKYLQCKPLIKYEPQGDFLRLLMCGDGTAIGFRFGIALGGKWVWQLKDHIDVMFMNLFKLEFLPSTCEGSLDTTQYDAKQMTGSVSVYHVDAPLAAAELLRTDDQVDYLMNWAILRRCMADNSYKESVLAAVQNLTETVRTSLVAEPSLPIPYPGRKPERSPTALDFDTPPVSPTGSPADSQADNNKYGYFSRFSNNPVTLCMRDQFPVLDCDTVVSSTDLRAWRSAASATSPPTETGETQYGYFSRFSKHQAQAAWIAETPTAKAVDKEFDIVRTQPWLEQLNTLRATAAGQGQRKEFDLAMRELAKGCMPA
jgi:selenide,water dikinase